MPGGLTCLTTWGKALSHVYSYDFVEKLRIAQKPDEHERRTKRGIDLSGEYPKRYRCITNRYSKIGSLGII